MSFVDIFVKRLKKRLRQLVHAEGVEAIAYAYKYIDYTFDGASASVSDMESLYSYSTSQSSSYDNPLLMSQKSSQVSESKKRKIFDIVDPHRVVETYKFFVEHFVLSQSVQTLAKMQGYANSPFKEMQIHNAFEMI